MLDTAAPTDTRNPTDPLRRDLKIVRELDADAAEAVAQFHASPLLAECRVNLIALDAIAARLGERWCVRRGQVYDQVERILHRNMGPHGHYIRVSDTDYLVAQPDAGPFGAQAICLRTMSEVLIFFLGPGPHTDICVHMVTGLSSNQIVAQPIDHKAALDGEEREVRHAASGMAYDPTLLSPERWSPFVAASGQRVRVSCVLEPVYELKNNTRIGYRLRRRVLDMATEQPLSDHAIRDLSRADLLKIDMATIARGMARLEVARDDAQELSLILPVSFVSLSNRSARDLLAQAFTQVRAIVLKGVICEVCDIDDIPQGPLLAAVSLIKPRTLFIVGHLTDAPERSMSGLKGAGLQAVSFDCPRTLGGDAEFIGWLRVSIAAAQRACKSVMVYGCDSPRRAAMAALVGATHASFRSG